MATDTEKAGFEIDGVFYPIPEAFRLGDTVLVEELLPKRLTFKDFAEALDDEDARQNPAILIPFVAVAVWQKHKNWSRDKVKQFVERIDFESFDVRGVGDDAPASQEEMRPPAEGSPES